MPVRIAYSVAREIAEQAARAAPSEACGLLAGADGRISHSFPVSNRASAPEAQFELDPREELIALNAIDKRGLKLLGAYHSHPESPPIPSGEDIAGAVDAGLMQLILSLDGGAPRFKLWRIGDGRVMPIELIFEGQPAVVDDRPLSRRQEWAVVIAGLASLLILLALALALLPPAPDLSALP